MADVPQLFFVATTLKACYGELRSPDVDGHVDYNASAKRSKGHLSEAIAADRSNVLDGEYVRLYDAMRSKLTDIRNLVRAHVERASTAELAYAFMNIYGLCCFDQPNIVNAKEEPCKFTGLLPNRESEPARPNDVVTVTGIISPLLASRIQHGQADYTRCAERDYTRGVVEIARLNSKASARTPRVSSNHVLGNSIESMEKRFIFNVRQDLHYLGCAYRQIICIVELLYLNMLRYVHA